MLTTTFCWAAVQKRNSLPGQPFTECEDVAQKPKAGIPSKKFFFPEVALILFPYGRRCHKLPFFLFFFALKISFLFDFSCFEFAIPFLPFEHSIEQRVENIFFMNIFLNDLFFLCILYYLYRLRSF